MERETFRSFFCFMKRILDYGGIAWRKRVFCCTTKITSNRSHHDIPIFAMTANTFAKGSRNCRNAGMNSYISKPVNVKDIETALTDLKGETQKPQK